MLIEQSQPVAPSSFEQDGLYLSIRSHRSIPASRMPGSTILRSVRLAGRIGNWTAWGAGQPAF